MASFAQVVAKAAATEDAPARAQEEEEPAAVPGKAAAASADPGVLAPCDLNLCQPVASEPGDGTPLAKRKSVERPRCKVCAVRLPLTSCHSLVCRCGGLFCSAHLHGGHECNFDYRGSAKEKLAKAMPEVKFAKI